MSALLLLILSAVSTTVGIIELIVTIIVAIVKD